MSFQDMQKRRSGHPKKRAMFFRDGGRKELRGLSKTAWQDIAWNLAERCAEKDDAEGIQDVLVEEAVITCAYRKGKVTP